MGWNAYLVSPKRKVALEVSRHAARSLDGFEELGEAARSLEAIAEDQQVDVFEVTPRSATLHDWKELTAAYELLGRLGTSLQSGFIYNFLSAIDGGELEFVTTNDEARMRALKKQGYTFIGYGDA